jgi:hypothetical protein
VLRSTARRLAAVIAVAALTVAALVSVSAADVAKHRVTLYHHFCPLTPAQVAAAGPYTAPR